MKKQTKKELLNDLGHAQTTIEYLEYDAIPSIIRQLKKYKLSKDEVQEFSLDSYIEWTENNVK